MPNGFEHVPTFLAAITKLLGWVKSVENQETERSEKITEQQRRALESVAGAAGKTRSYLAKIRDGPAKESEKTEGKLRDLWTKAGIDLLGVDDDLAERCLLKADYWADPDGWLKAGRDDSKIKLDELYEEARTALMNRTGS